MLHERLRERLALVKVPALFYNKISTTPQKSVEIPYLCEKFKNKTYMAEKQNIKVSDLTFDDKNFNKHTEFGMSLLEKSLRKNGAGRSILIDKNNRIIAGNGVVETAGQIGLEDVQIVESDGTKLIAVKRTDIDLDSKEGREMALADNATSAADLSWDYE